MSDKPFKTVNEQIGVLKDERQLNMLNVEAAKDILTRYGYYEIINGYKEPFLNNPKNDDEGYKPDATFEHIFALFTLDKHLRELTLQALEEFENTFKQAVAYCIAECISDEYTRYAAPSHYNRGKTFKDRNGNPKNRPPRNAREKLLWKLKRLSETDKQPFAYYREEHHNIPPWIMVKGMTLGEVIHWYSLSKKEVRDAVISRLTRFPVDLIEALDKKDKIRQAIGDSLALILDYRNLTAHGGRVYNHRSKKYALRASSFLLRPSILATTPERFKHGYRQSSLGALIRILNIFDNPDPKWTIETWLVIQLAAHLRTYPGDENLLVKALEIDGTSIMSDVKKSMTRKVTIEYEN